MKRIAALLTALCLLLAQALAETTIDPKEARNIPLTEAGENKTPDGISPTTGRTLSKLYVPEGYAGLAATGRYLPMLVQIGNDGGGVGNRAPWGVAYADILYETPLTRSHETRITAVFSDMIPDSVGFVRSARIGHVWLSEEWGGGFLFYGQQEVEGSDVKAEIKRIKREGVSVETEERAGPGRKADWEMKANYKDPLALLLDVMNNPDAPKSLRYQAAKDSLAYCHPRIAESGKKEKEQEKAEKLSKGGRFQRKAAPQRVVN